MIAITVFILCVLAVGDAQQSSIQCDYYEGYPVTEAKAAFYTKLGVEDKCTLKIKPCDPNEKYRRLDGSCNNLNRGCRGTYFDKMPRILPASYTNGYFHRKAKSGKDLRAPRFIRTHLIKEGPSVHKELTTAVPNYASFGFSDMGSPHDITNVLLEHQHTCDPAYKEDYWSTPYLVPKDDPIHRFSGISCLNATRPIYHQSYNCTQDSVPSPIVTAITGLDLSQIYNFYNTDADKIRTFVDGLLVVEEDNGKYWPTSGGRGNCLTNEGNETRCFAYLSNALPFQIVFNVILYRNHNYFASKLKEVNPNWDDEKLFHTARDMNIAMYTQIYLYEMMGTLIGRQTLIEAGILSEHDGHRDVYDDTLYPTVILEFSYIQRWFHKLQSGIINLYDKEGNISKQVKLTETVFRTGFLASNENIAGVTASIFRQPTSDPDSVEYDIAEHGLGNTQKAGDIITGDIERSRSFGFPPYVDYLQYCFGVNVTTFEELEPFISEENIELLKDCYDDAWDIDLMAGVTSENYIKDGYVPHTFACIAKEFLHKLVRSDRFFYERSKRPNSFSKAQLKEIRKSTLSMLLCNVGDDVTEIQPNAFRISGPGNEMVPCEKIPNIDFSAWADDSCSD